MKNKYLDLTKELKKTMDHPGGFDTSCAWNDSQRFGKCLGRVCKWRTWGFYLNYSIVKIGQNTEKSPETCKDLLSVRLHWKANAVKDTQGEIKQ